MTQYRKSIAATGHTEVSRAAAVILEAGGNAFDAVAAAGFASCVVEPALNSLGGGGLLLGYSAEKGQKLFFDFFVDTPGRDHLNPNLEPNFFPVTVSFSGSDQEFNVGLGAVAVPGTLKGLLHIHKRLGRMALKDIIAPAVGLANGHVLNANQAHFLQLLKPIMTLLPQGRAIYQATGTYLREQEILRNDALQSFLQQIIIDRGESFYQGEIAEKISKEMCAGGGLLTREDLLAYQVKEHKPLRVPFRDYTLFTAPPPSIGGTLIGLSLSLLGQETGGIYPFGSAEYLLHTTALMREVEKLRAEGCLSPGDFEKFLGDEERFAAASDTIRLFSRGTTHISIADKEGNCASMTCSNGEGSGYFAPDSGVMLNNMMGEDDLHPDGFHSSPAGQRVASMMSPSFLTKDDRVELVIGSGGSKRIRTAISQVLVQVTDLKKSLQDAVDAPRLHWDGDMLQVEPGFPTDSMVVLKQKMDVNVWGKKGVYFGGVHAVIPGKVGAGDPRRGGAVSEVSG